MTDDHADARLPRRRFLQYGSALAAGGALPSLRLPAALAQQPPSITSVTQSAASLPAGAPLTVTVALDAAFSNPDDPAQIEVWATVTEPGGAAHLVPGFLYQPYRVDGRRLVTAGSPRWTIRYTPRQRGDFTYRVGVRTPQGEDQSGARQFTATLAQPTYKGFIRINPDGPVYYQRIHSREMFFPLGLNADVPALTRPGNGHAEPESRYHGLFGDGRYNPADGASPENLFAVYDQYRRAIEGLGTSGGNVLRLRLDSWWLPLELDPDDDVPGYPQGVPGFTVGRYHPAMSWIVDETVEQARSRGVAVALCTWNGNSPWGDSTYALQSNAALVRRRLRYQVARWGYSPAVWAFELFNEVNEKDGTITEVDLGNAFWTARIAELRELDINDHPVFNSYPGIDQRELHTYVETSGENFLSWADFNADGTQPYVLSEYGKRKYFLDPVDSDPRGLKAHEAAWASIFGHKTGALYWWLYPHVEPLGLYQTIYGAVSAFLDGEQFAGVAWERATFTRSAGPGGQDYRGMVGDRRRALVWAVRTLSGELQDRAPANGNVIRVGPLATGNYEVTWTDTFSGALLQQGTGTVADGTLRLNVPDGVRRAAAAKVSPVP